MSQRFELEIQGYDYNHKEYVALTPEGQIVGLDPFLKNALASHDTKRMGPIVVRGILQKMPVRDLIIVEKIES